MAAKTGNDFKFYYNSAETSGVPNFATPTWSLVCNVRDVNRNLTKNSADISTRCGGGYRQKRAGLKEGKIELEMVWDPTDTALLFLRDKYESGEMTHIADADGPIATSGTIYWSAPMEVTDFSISEPLEEGVIVSISLEVAFHTTEAPGWTTVA